MKIAIIRQRYSPHGGAEKFISRALAALSSDEVQVSLIARDWEAVERIDFHRCDPFYIGRIWRDWGFAKHACQALTSLEIDLVQSHERIGCCDIYRAGDGVHREWLKQRSRVLSRPKKLAQTLSPYHHYLKSAEKKLFEGTRLRAVICNSKMVKKEIQHYFQISNEKLHVIYSGVDVKRYHPELKHYRSEFRSLHHIPQDATLYAFVGSGFFRKGLEQVLKAMACLDQRCYLIIAGYDKQQKYYEKLANRLGLEKRTLFLGSVKDVKPCYGAADVFVLPTLYDPFPNAVLEAFATGLPVITSEKSGAAEVIEQGHNGYVCDALDVTSLTHYMCSLQDRKLAYNMGEQARRTAEKFEMNHMVNKLTQLYQRLEQ